MTVNQFGNPAPFLNGSNYAQPRDDVFGAGRDGGREMGDESMERIRELLFGELRRSWEARLQTLETRLQMLEDKLDAVKHEARTDRKDHLAALAEGIDELGQHVRRLTRG